MKLVVGFLCLLAVTNVFARSVNNVTDFQTRIISGQPAAPGQFPWQVILKREEIDDLLCGGSIISNIWVLTAAHCTYGLESIYLVFGSIFLENDKALTMTSTQMYPHPNYNNENLNNDVSLIKLPTPLTFSKSIQAISLVPASQSSNSFIGTMAIIAGFGLMDDEELEYSQVLQWAQVEVIKNTQCEAVFGAGIVVSSTMCAKGNQDSNMSICSGDSGGPLIARDSSGNYRQIAINSFVAEDMCTAGYPSGYARLTSFLGFIQQITGINYSQIG